MEILSYSLFLYCPVIFGLKAVVYYYRGASLVYPAVSYHKSAYVLFSELVNYDHCVHNTEPELALLC